MTRDTSVADVTFVAFDFETTGLYPAQDKIVEFGAVKFKGGAVVDTFQQLANPGIPITEDAARISGIDSDMVVSAPPVAEVLPRFVEFLGEAVLVAHNAPFDLAFLRAALTSEGKGVGVGGGVANTIIDTQILAQKAFPRQKSYSLQNLVGFLAIPPNQAHRALDDAVMCMKLFVACVEALSFMGELTMGEVLT